MTDAFVADPLLTEREAAELLDKQASTLAVWRCTKRYPLEYIKIGRSVRYRRSTVLAFIEAGKVSA